MKSNILRNRPSLSHTISHIRLTNSDLNLGPCGYSFASRSEDCCLAFQQQPGSGVLSKNQKSCCSCFMDRLNSGNNFCCMCRRMNNNRWNCFYFKWNHIIQTLQWIYFLGAALMLVVTFQKLSKEKGVESLTKWSKTTVRFIAKIILHVSLYICK